MKNTKFILFSLLFLLVLFACTDDQCHLDTETLLKVEMSVNDPSTPGKYIDSLAVYAPEWTDSLFYKNEGEGKSLWLMLSPQQDTTTFIFTSNLVEQNDTLNFIYQRKQTLLSAECGFVTHYTIDTILHTKNYIDSLFLEKNSITTDEQGLVKIYF